ncbi:MFS transporter [Congregibacter litoralis]|uniref:Sugar phosphate permease n=1 Tax=Congregibacter litoralis KT71 TaxID=314285 RepID=A4ABT1_9GAMM|nr:MFS transporter [Congregibacter litoralis]EAQ96594.2 Sugar phosphate permease [Congregibacter litoralis KT71]
MNDEGPSSRRLRWLYMASLILAGDSIYLLVYMRQSFQTSMHEVFEISYTQLGIMNSMYGLLAITAYFAGGWLSDRVATRTLLSFSLFATGLGGYYMATIPSYPMLLALHAFWGVSTILTFWAALVKATRLWGGSDDQGRTFGILDAGRGLVGAVMMTAGAWVFSRSALAADGLVDVILLYATASMAAGLCVLAFIPPDHAHGSLTHSDNSNAPAGQLRVVARMPAVWLQALIILMAYWLYLGSFEFATFAEKVFDQDKVFGASLSAFREWLRPVSAIAAGFLADRIRASRAVSIAFITSAVGYGALALIPGRADLLWMLWIQISAVAIAVFALRGIYFALMEESKIPLLVTGTAVGLVSTIGFTADVFAYPMVGWFLDNYGPATGYQYYFSILAGASVFGLFLTLTLGWQNQRGKPREQ